MIYSEEEAKKIKPDLIIPTLLNLCPNTKNNISWWLHFCIDDNLALDKRKEIAYNFGLQHNIDIDFVVGEVNYLDLYKKNMFVNLVKDSFWCGVSRNTNISENSQIYKKMFEKVYNFHGIKYLVDKEDLPDDLVEKIVNINGNSVLDYYTGIVSNKIKAALLSSDDKSIRSRAENIWKVNNFNPFFENVSKETKKASDTNQQAKQKGVLDDMEKSKLEKIKDTVIDEIPEATVRISARQFVKLACAPIQGVCIRYDAHKANMFMQTQYGKSLVSLISSESLRFVKFENQKYNNIKNSVAKELRIQAFTGVGNEILDTLRPIVYDALKSVLSNNVKNTITNSNTNLLSDGASVSSVNVTAAKNKVEV